jgi:cyclic dehypoxanthinyl futalosine synthase
MTLEIAAVQYLNARPLYEHLRGPEIALGLGVPSQIARRVAEGEAELGLIPVASLAEFGDLRVVPGAAIGTRGAVRSVLLVSQVPLEELETVVLDASSRTSAILARLLLRQRLGREPRIRVLPSAEAVCSVRGTTGALVIGDPALELVERFAYAWDLGEAWRAWTGLPFVFAVWAGRARSLPPGTVDLLLAAKEAGLAAREGIAAEHAQRSGLPVERLHDYLHDAISYDLGDEELRGLRRFFAEAHQAGLLPRTEVQFYEDERSAPRPSLDTLLSRAAAGERLSGADGERLLAEAPLMELGLAADAVRRRKHPHGVVTYIVDRNVNYTNVCTTSCRFCAFYRPVGHPEGYVLSRDVLRQKLSEVVRAGGVQILLQGGLNPDLRITYYEELFRWIKSEFALGLHALSPEEIIHIARMESLTVRQVLERLHAAGLDSVPGGGAEILVDRVRRKIAKAKCRSEEWLGVMRQAHHMGLRSSATMMYGTVDTARDRVLHLLKLRDLQDETGGFTAFFCWDFRHEQGVRIAAGDTGTHLYLRQQAVARLMLDNIDHVGASWVTQGPDIGQVALRFGADDFGSVMFEENVVSSAGTTYGIDAAAIEARIRGAGFKATRRNVKYEWLTEPS